MLHRNVKKKKPTHKEKFLILQKARSSFLALPLHRPLCTFTNRPHTSVPTNPLPISLRPKPNPGRRGAAEEEVVGGGGGGAENSFIRPKITTTWRELGATPTHTGAHTHARRYTLTQSQMVFGAILKQG